MTVHCGVLEKRKVISSDAHVTVACMCTALQICCWLFGRACMAALAFHHQHCSRVRTQRLLMARST
jgi:hypothetical protein